MCVSRVIPTPTLLFCLAIVCMRSTLLAQPQTISAGVVSAELSTREAFVGRPISFRITVLNGSTQSPPSAPEVAGLRFSKTPRPSRSHQMQIINGRRSSSVTTTWGFQVVAERAGEFTIPSIAVVANKQTYLTEPLKFVATKSETGDLMFVEIDDGSGDTDSPKGYVGQAIKLKLKIWLRPYTDRQRNYKLNAQSMWDQVAEKTSWGVFEETLQLATEGKAELSASEVLRRDSEGNLRSYYLYEIETAVYPKRPGKIDVDDVKIVVEYPTGLGRSRRQRFGLFGPSLLEEMMGGGARMPSRPISAMASSPSIEILEVPFEGRPKSYRGAVGKYRIVAEATPTEVNAGDSINLQIGLQGDGPMELVQAPPLSQMTSLTDDFKVADDALAGFVQGNGKLFTTTLRPLREGISSIPPIPFSYFDPKSEKFKTTYTEPIPLKVAAANQLSLDEIVGRNPGNQDLAGPNDEPAKQDAKQSPPFVSQNYAANRVIANSSRGWLSWLLLALPPVVLGGLWLVREGPTTLQRMRGAPGPLQTTMLAVRRAKTISELSEVLRGYDSFAEGATEPEAEAQTTTDLQPLQKILERCESCAFSPAPGGSLSELREAALRELRKHQ